LIATHNFALAARMDRVLQLEEGLLVEATHRHRPAAPEAAYAAPASLL
jgi:hypothetical protein